MIFWKSRFTCNYSTRENLKSRYPKTVFMYLLEKNHPSKSSEAWFISSLGEYLQIWWSMKGFEEFNFFRILKALKAQKSNMAAIFGPYNLSEKIEI